jgi:hypothetical protein
MAAVAPIIADADCSQPNVYGAEFDPATMVCAGYLSGGSTPASGTAAGRCRRRRRAASTAWFGVTSWGKGCARRNAPGVYVRVADTALRNAIAADVFAIENTQGLAHESVVGSGAQPPRSAASSATTAGVRWVLRSRRRHSCRDPIRSRHPTGGLGHQFLREVQADQEEEQAQAVHQEG